MHPMLSVAPHTPAHIAAWMRTLIAHLAPTIHEHLRTQWMLCASLPEAPEAEIRYLCLSPDAYPPRSLAQWCTHITHAVTATPNRHMLAHGWLLNIGARSLQHATQTRIDLTEMECELLAYFTTHPTRDIPREELMQHVWHYDASTQSHTAETHLYRLRQKLEAITPAPCAILTTEGGYRFTL